MLIHPAVSWLSIICGNGICSLDDCHGRPHCQLYKMGDYLDDYWNTPLGGAEGRYKWPNQWLNPLMNSRIEWTIGRREKYRKWRLIGRGKNWGGGCIGCTWPWYFLLPLYSCFLTGANSSVLKGPPLTWRTKTMSKLTLWVVSVGCLVPETTSIHSDRHLAAPKLAMLS